MRRLACSSPAVRGATGPSFPLEGRCTFPGLCRALFYSDAGINIVRTFDLAKSVFGCTIGLLFEPASAEATGVPCPSPAVGVASVVALAVAFSSPTSQLGCNIVGEKVVLCVLQPLPRASLRPRRQPLRLELRLRRSRTPCLPLQRKPVSRPRIRPRLLLRRLRLPRSS